MKQERGGALLRMKPPERLPFAIVGEFFGKKFLYHVRLNGAAFRLGIAFWPFMCVFLQFVAFRLLKKVSLL